MPDQTADPRTLLRGFLLDNYLFTDDESALADDASFLEGGILDSTGILELVMYLEETFQIKIDDEEMVPENLDSVAAALAFLKRKRSAAA